jgi:hypothetical protein
MHRKLGQGGLGRAAPYERFRFSKREALNDDGKCWTDVSPWDLPTYGATGFQSWKLFMTRSITSFPDPGPPLLGGRRPPPSVFETFISKDLLSTFGYQYWKNCVVENSYGHDLPD